MVNSIVALAIAAFASQLAFANDSTSQVSIRRESLADRAKQEIQQTGQVKSKSTDVVVSETMLSLEDPRPNLQAQKFIYHIGLTAQSFHPKGIMGNELTGARFDLSENGGAVLPSFEAGFSHDLLGRQSWSTQWGINARFAYTSQKAEARFETGFVENDVRLNTMLWGAGPTLSMTHHRVPWLKPVLGLEWGRLTYTQVSGNELASVSRRGAYSAWSGGLEFRLNRTWNLLTRYTQRQLSRATDDIQLQTDNFELGTRIIW